MRPQLNRLTLRMSLKELVGQLHGIAAGYWELTHDDEGAPYSLLTVETNRYLSSELRRIADRMDEIASYRR